MAKYILILLIVLSCAGAAQSIDTLKGVNRDTIQTTAADTIMDSVKTISNLERLNGINIIEAPLSENSFLLTNEFIQKSDYKSTGDLIKYIPFGFTADYGTYGQKNPVSLYGIWSDELSILEDGVPINNQYTFFEMNIIPAEEIQTIEVIPLVRGFLYSNFQNSTAINFITKDFLTTPPFTRIKYSQGNYGEAGIDVIFNALVADNMNAFVEINNSKVDDRYTNSASGIWNAKVKLKYITERFNISGSYSLSDIDRGYNGGVDYDSVLKFNKDPEDILYDEVLAPVKMPLVRQHILHHRAGIKALYIPAENMLTTLDLYYRFYKLEVFLNDKEFMFNDKGFDNSFGLRLKQDIRTKVINTQIFAILENSQFNHVNTFDLQPADKRNLNSISAGASITYSGSKVIVPSLFFKLLSVQKMETTPFYIGGDLKYNISKNLEMYAGYAIRPSDESNIEFIEAGLKYFSENFLSGIKYFNKDESTSNILNKIMNTTSSNVDEAASFVLASGINIFNRLKIWKLEIENNLSISTKNSSHYKRIEPSYYSVSGVFYRDTLFNSNLDLKAGINVYTFGSRIVNDIETDDAFRLDFTLAGTIQKSATIYFTIENILGKRYFLQPYYPMPLTGVRFGVAWELTN